MWRLNYKKIQVDWLKIGRARLRTEFDNAVSKKARLVFVLLVSTCTSIISTPTWKKMEKIYMYDICQSV